MTSGNIDESQRRAARVAGLTLLFGMAIVVFGEFYISTNLIVPGNAAETARNIIANETRFRINIACDLIYAANVAVLLASLYTILRPVDRNFALAAAVCRLIYAMMWIVIPLNMLGALTLLGDANYLHVFEADRLQTLSRLHLRANFDAYYVGLPFFGLASTICSYLWLKSGYVPRALAAFGVLASAWCVMCAFAFIIFPTFNKTVNDWWFDTPLALFELAMAFWLLFKGLRPSVPAESIP
jgi:hypothetical protein